jgi:ferredoxin
MNDLKLMYFSPTSTTKNVVQNIALGFNADYIEYDLTPPSNRLKEFTFNKNDILIIGVPVYSGRIPTIIEPLLRTLDGKGSLAIIVAVYGNRDYDDCLLELYDLMTSCDFKVISAASFVGEHSYTSDLATNRPDQKDLSIAKSFGVKIKNYADCLDVNSKISLNIKGNRPYRELSSDSPIAPVINSSCTNCLICLKHCPSGAISFNEKIAKIAIDENKCIKCHSCVKRCPSNSIDFDGILDKSRMWLVDSFGENRCEPEIIMDNIISK